MSEPNLDGQVEAFFDTFARWTTPMSWPEPNGARSAPQRPPRSGCPRPFILRRDADRLRVVFYLNHQDLTRALSPA
jgi:hypothetical protein